MFWKKRKGSVNSNAKSVVPKHIANIIKAGEAFHKGFLDGIAAIEKDIPHIMQGDS